MHITMNKSSLLVFGIFLLFQGSASTQTKPVDVTLGKGDVLRRRPHFLIQSGRSAVALA